MAIAQYPKLKEAADKTKDQVLIDLVAKLEPLLGTDDGKPENEFLSNAAEASRAISRSDKVSKVVKQQGTAVTKKRTAEGDELNRVVVYSKNLFPFVNDEGDTIINAIFERVIELAE